jgi:flagellar hook-associated protein 3 FlgL
MQTNLDPEAALFVAQVNRIQQRIADANSQVSSGKRINVASDAPDQIGPLLQLRSDRQRNSQIQTNLALAATEANGADDALSSALKLMDSALSLTAQGASATLDPAGRQTLAQQIQGIQQQMVAYSSTTVEGRYIFSGDQGGTPSYAYDPTAANSVVQLANATSTRLIEDPAGGSFVASLTAKEIFDLTDPISGAPASGNVFVALSNVVQALQGGDATAVAGTVSALKAATDHLNSMEAFYGNVQNRLQNASAFATKYDTDLQTEISQKEDADITAAALELTQANTQLQAAFQMRAQRPHTSLFNYLG